MGEAVIQKTMPAEAEIPPPLTFTEAAARKVWELIEEEGNPKLMLRVYITGGGCSGFQYGFTFDENVNADDMVIEKIIKKTAANDEIKADAGADGEAGTQDEEDGGEQGMGAGNLICVKLLIDPMSLQYLAGAEIDYEKKLQAEQFVIRNPNAKTTCGCGSSFAA